ncbi:MAG: SulP family inorganic anion transporter [Fusobacterium sp.]|nr:SulP family inorganic anion transporter [Fusobacterium sp.]
MFKLKLLIGDTLGALSSAIVALPQLLAFGVVTGLGASAGIWGAIILCVVTAILGPKVPFISGITGPVTIVIASIMHALNGDVSAVVLILAMAGILQTILSLTSFPSIVKYMPYPVISGFMNGIGVILIIMQLNPLFGLSAKSNTIESLHYFITNLSNINTDALLIGGLTLAIVFLLPKKFPSQVLALIICTFISIKMGLNLTRISEVSISFPQIHIPQSNLHDIITYAHYAITLAIVLCVESLLTGLVADSLLKTKTSSKRLLFGQGIGNIFCALTGSLSGTAATMRTVAAINSGATTRLTILINPLILAILLFKFSGFVAEIPLAVLAGILIKIGFDIIDVKLLKVIKFAPKDDLYVLFLVFLLTVFYNLIVAVGTGIVFAALLYAKRIADKTKLVEKRFFDNNLTEIEKQLEEDFEHKIRVVHIEGQFFFGSATQLISQFDEILGTKYLILDYSSEDLMDISAIFALEDILIRLKSQKIKTILVLHNQDLYNQLDGHGIISQIGKTRVFFDETEAIDYTKKCFQRLLKNPLD